LLTELTEDEVTDDLCTILCQNEFQNLLFKLVQSEKFTSSPFELLLNLAGTKKFSAKVLHHDNLLDFCILNKKGEILSTLLTACDNSDLR
jgi:hypothetical protein